MCEREAFSFLSHCPLLFLQPALTSEHMYELFPYFPEPLKHFPEGPRCNSNFLSNPQTPSPHPTHGRNHTMFELEETLPPLT